MASQHSLTIQLADPSLSPFSPGHTALLINTPAGQTYAGFGSSNRWLWSFPGKFDSYTVQPGETPARDFSNVFGHNSYATFTIPVSPAQAEAANAQVNRLKKSPGNYNLLYSEYCTTIVNQIMEAAGLGSNLLYSVPSRNIQYLSDIEKALALDRKAKFTTDGAGNRIPIPEAFRGLQRDYAYSGGGYDTSSERVRRVVSSGENNGSPDRAIWRNGAGAIDLPPSASAGALGTGFGNWSPSPAGGSGNTLPPSMLKPQQSREPAFSYMKGFLQYLDQLDGKSPAAGSDMPAPAPPLVSASPDRQNPLGARTGASFAADGSGAPLAPPMFEPQSSQGSTLPYAEEYDQYQRRLNGNKPQAPMFDPTKPPPPFDPSSPYAPVASGSIGNWIRSLAGVDADDPTQFVPPIFSPLYRR